MTLLSTQREALCGQIQLRAEHRPLADYSHTHLLNENQTLFKLRLHPGEGEGICNLTDGIPFSQGMLQLLVWAVMLHTFLSHFLPAPSWHLNEAASNLGEHSSRWGFRPWPRQPDGLPAQTSICLREGANCAGYPLLSSHAHPAFLRTNNSFLFSHIKRTNEMHKTPLSLHPFWLFYSWLQKTVQVQENWFLPFK